MTNEVLHSTAHSFANDSSQLWTIWICTMLTLGIIIYAMVYTMGPCKLSWNKKCNQYIQPSLRIRPYFVTLSISELAHILPNNPYCTRIIELFSPSHLPSSIQAHQDFCALLSSLLNWSPYQIYGNNTAISTKLQAIDQKRWGTEKRGEERNNLPSTNAFHLELWVFYNKGPHIVEKPVCWKMALRDRKNQIVS